MAFVAARQSANGAALMVKILARLIAAIVIAAGGFFGFEFYVQRRIASEVEAAFARSARERRQGEPRQGLVRPVEPHHHGRGHCGRIRPRSRRSTVKIGRFVATGVSQPEAGRFAAERIEATDVEVGGTVRGAGAACASPTRRRGSRSRTTPGRPARCAGSIPPRRPICYRFALEHFAAITAPFGHAADRHRQA